MEIKIKLGDRELTLEEARKIYNELDTIFGKQVEQVLVPSVPIPYPVYPTKQPYWEPFISYTSGSGTKLKDEVPTTSNLSNSQSESVVN